jgi:hypothetical protein
LVVEVLLESTSIDNGLAMPAGSVKVTYANGEMAKWVPPEAFSVELRAQRQWSSSDADESSEPSGSLVAGQKTISFAKSFSTLFPSMGLGSGLEAAASTPDDDVDDDAFIVSGPAGVARGVLGRYRKVGEHKDRPKYRNQHGAVIYFDEYWKMNVKDDVLHWCYEVRASAEEQPPTQAWAVYHFYGDSACPAPTVARAADVELLAVSGVAGAGRAVNGRYVQAGMHNDMPKFKNSSGAIVFFDGYWKMNDRDDVLAWRFATKEVAAGQEPPSGAWPAHWSAHTGQAPALVRVRQGAGEK